jgi:predicted phage-related endonuclease
MTKARHKPDRRHFIGGSDARIIVGKDEKALMRLWREKRGEEAPPDLSSVLTVQLGLATEDLNRRLYELNSGHRIADVQRHAIHRTIPWMVASVLALQNAQIRERIPSKCFCALRRENRPQVGTGLLQNLHSLIIN